MFTATLKSYHMVVALMAKLNVAPTMTWDEHALDAVCQLGGLRD